MDRGVGQILSNCYPYARRNEGGEVSLFGRRNKRNREPSYLPYGYEGFYPVGQHEVNRNQYYFNPYTPNHYSNMYADPFSYGQPAFNGNMYKNNWNPYVQEENPYNQYQKYPADAILQNPLQPKKNQGTYGGANPYMNSYPYMHPYPKPGVINRPPSGINSVINSFKTQDGNLDLNKMIDTAGQMMNAVSQVSGLVKGLGGIFKV